MHNFVGIQKHTYLYFKKDNLWCANNISIKLFQKNITREASHITALNGKAMISITIGFVMNMYWKMGRKKWRYTSQNVSSGLLRIIRNSTLPFLQYGFLHVPNNSSQPCLYQASTPAFAASLWPYLRLCFSDTCHNDHLLVYKSLPHAAWYFIFPAVWGPHYSSHFINETVKLWEIQWVPVTGPPRAKIRFCAPKTNPMVSYLEVLHQKPGQWKQKIRRARAPGCSPATQRWGVRPGYAPTAGKPLGLGLRKHVLVCFKCISLNTAPKDFSVTRLPHPKMLREQRERQSLSQKRSQLKSGISSGLRER